MDSRLHRRAVIAAGLSAFAAGAARAAPDRLQDAPISVTTISADDLKLVREINLARTSPLDYIGRLPRAPTAAEAREFLRNFRPAPALEVDDRLWRAANGHLRDLQGSGRIEHRGSDGSMPMGRINREGLYSMMTAEGISVGQVEAVDIVRQLLIDSSSPTRAHRQDLMNPRFTLIGPASGPHPKFKRIVVIDYSAPPLKRD